MELRRRGFKDIEKESHGEFYLIDWDSLYFQTKSDPTTFPIKQNYFYMAEHFLNSARFKATIESPIHREIWHLHSNGFSYREIAHKLKEKPDISSWGEAYNKDKIQALIHRMKKLLKVFITEEDSEKR